MLAPAPLAPANPGPIQPGKPPLSLGPGTTEWLPGGKYVWNWTPSGWLYEWSSKDRIGLLNQCWPDGSALELKDGGQTWVAEGEFFISWKLSLSSLCYGPLCQADHGAGLPERTLPLLGRWLENEVEISYNVEDVREISRQELLADSSLIFNLMDGIGGVMSRRIQVEVLSRDGLHQFLGLRSGTKKLAVEQAGCCTSAYEGLAHCYRRARTNVVLGISHRVKLFSSSIKRCVRNQLLCFC